MKQINNNLKNKSARRRRIKCRAGAATIDYFLVVCLVVTIAAFTTYAVPKMIRLVYEMTVTLVGSPLM